MSKQPDALPAEPPLPKSRHPGFVKFTTYVRRPTHLEAKTLALRQGRELSEIVEDLLAGWVRRHQP